MCKVLKYKSDRSLYLQDSEMLTVIRVWIFYAMSPMGSHSLIKFIQLANLSVNMSKFGCFNSSIDLLQSFMFQNAMPVDFRGLLGVSLKRKLIGKFELNPKGDQCGCCLSID